MPRWQRDCLEYYGLWECDHHSDELVTVCNECQDPQLFQCKKNGLNICIPEQLVRDGVGHCDDSADESDESMCRSVKIQLFTTGC